MPLPDEFAALAHNPVDDWLGFEWHEITPERVVATVDLGPAHHQPLGLVHGGVLCAVVESVASFGGAAFAHAIDRNVVGVNNSTDFIRAHKEGRCDVVGEPIHTGRSQQLWEVRISRQSDGKLVARGQVRLANVERDRF